MRPRWPRLAGRGCGLALLVAGLLLWGGAPGTVRAAGDASAGPKTPAGDAAKGGKGAPKRTASWYASTMAEDERGSFLIVHFWSLGPLLRSEAVLGGRRIVTIVNRDTYYVVDAVGGNGVAITRSEAARKQDESRGRPFGNELEQLLREGGEHIGTESAGSQTVDVYRLTDDRGRRTVWMSRTDPPVPLRVLTFDRPSGTNGKLDYVNWLQDPSLPETFFEPDPRWRLERFGYDEYRKRLRQGPVGPAPVLYRHLLHGDNVE